MELAANRTVKLWPVMSDNLALSRLFISRGFTAGKVPPLSQFHQKLPEPGNECCEGSKDTNNEGCKSGQIHVWLQVARPTTCYTGTSFLNVNGRLS